MSIQYLSEVEMDFALRFKKPKSTCLQLVWANTSSLESLEKGNSLNTMSFKGKNVISEPWTIYIKLYLEDHTFDSLMPGVGRYFLITLMWKLSSQKQCVLYSWNTLHLFTQGCLSPSPSIWLRLFKNLPFSFSLHISPQLVKGVSKPSILYFCSQINTYHVCCLVQESSIFQS